MRPNRAIHTAKTGAKWVNRREGFARAIGAYDSKAEAVAAGRLVARTDHVEHILYRADGLLDEITRSSHSP